MTLIRQDWVPLFEEFIKYIRINSKEVAAIDKFGSPLNLWPSQKLALDCIVNGLGHDIHTFMFGKARQQGLCLHPKTKILTHDLKWINIENAKIGDRLISVDENLGDILPISKKKSDRKMRTCRVEAIRETYGMSYKIVFENKVEIIATGEHRFLCKDRGGCQPEWRAVSKIKIGDSLRYMATTWGDPSLEDYWFGGLLDGEGCLRPKDRAGSELSVSQVAGEVLDRARAYLISKGYVFREEIDNRKGGESSKLGNKPVHKFTIGRIPDIIKIVGQCRPVRFIGRNFWEGKGLPGKNTGLAYINVVSIEPLYEQRMIDLQTSTKTFIAEGIVSHNSTLIETLDIFWLATHNSMMGAYVIDKEKNLPAIRDKIKRYFNSFPPGFFGKKFQIENDNKEFMTFSNGSRLDFLTAGVGKKETNWGEGKGYTFLHATEVAKYGNPDGLASFRSTLAESHPDRLFIYESTSKGINHWRKCGLNLSAMNSEKGDCLLAGGEIHTTKYPKITALGKFTV